MGVLLCRETTVLLLNTYPGFYGKAPFPGPGGLPLPGPPNVTSSCGRSKAT